MATKKQSRSTGVPGDTVEEARQWAKKVHRYGIALMKLDRLMDKANGGTAMMHEIRVVAPSDTRADFLVIVKGFEGGKKLVGFHAALDPSDAIRGAIERYDNKSMKLREDRPYGE